MFRKFIDIAKEKVTYNEELDQFSGGFAERILKSELSSEDMKLYKIFLDIAMPAVSKHTFKQMMAFDNETMSTLLTVGEETFGFFVLENNINRWIWSANKEVAVNDDEDGSTKEDIPDLLYQKNKMRRKEAEGKSASRMFAGEYKEVGLRRFNDLARLVKEHRNNRTEIENEIRKMYVKEIDNEVIARMTVNRKRKHDKDKANDTMPKRVVVINLLE